MESVKLPTALILLLMCEVVHFIPVGFAQDDDLRAAVRSRLNQKRSQKLGSNAGRRLHPALLSRKDQLAIVSSLAQRTQRHEVQQKATFPTKSGIEHDEELYLPDQDIGVAHLTDVRVNCGKNIMDVTMTFDSPFSGMIYSKGHHSDPRCRYGDPSLLGNGSEGEMTSKNETESESTILPNTSTLTRRFSLQAGRCGSQIIDAGNGEAYFENTVVVQHTPGIQSAVDTARALRCVFEPKPGSGPVVSRIVSSSLLVDVLDVISVTYSGDSIDSYLDVQLGKGPFHANPVNGLVKIGETLTLVVFIHGDDYDVHVKDCVAHDGDAAVNSIRLSDKRGCVLTPKLMGPWQKTRDTANTGASAIAWAYLEAFKFPDKLEVFIECNIEICKYECHHDKEKCLEAKKARLRKRHERVSNTTVIDEKLLTRLRRDAEADQAQSQDRSSTSNNELSETAHLIRGIRVIAPEDVSEDSPSNRLIKPNIGVHSVSMAGNDQAASVVIMNTNQLCVSTTGFLFVTGLSVAILVALLLTIVGLYLRMRQLDPEVQLVNEAAMAGTIQRRHVIASISERAGQGAPRRKGDF